MRTERYYVCLGCFARQVQLDACARCGDPELAYVHDPAIRARVAERLAARGRERAAIVERSGWGSQVIAAGVVVGGIALALQMTLQASGAAFVAAAVGAALFAVLVARWRVVGAREDEGVIRSVTPRLECVDRVRAEAGEPPLAVARVQGRVRVTRPAVAPVSGQPCAAARVTGSAFGGVDDAVCGAFELVDPHGAVVGRYDGRGAAVDVPAADLTAREEVADPLRAFLDERLVFQAWGTVNLGEVILVDGDCVTLEGPAEDGVVTEGYRESRMMKVFRGTSTWPVVIRRPVDEGRVRVAEDVVTEVAEVESHGEGAWRARG